MQNRFRKVPSVDGWGELFDPDRELAEPRIFAIPYDDAAPFFSYLALPASDMYYGADYGMYHSIYENFHWMKTVVDPTFEYHAVMAQVQGRVALRLANAELPPLDFGEEARIWRMAYADLDGIARERGGEVPELGQAMKLIDRWEAEAELLVRDARAFLSDAGRVARAGSKLADLSRAVQQMPRDFLRSGGRPEAPLDRNLFAGSSYDFESVSGSTLPGLRFALDTGAFDVAKTEATIYLKALRRRVESLRSLRREMSRIE
jgi:N-acetylated-alpha-linked acidic dipeptidase